MKEISNLNHTGFILKLKLCSARRSEEDDEHTTCPVCNEPINGSPAELNEHVDHCLNRVDTLLYGRSYIYIAGVTSFKQNSRVYADMPAR